MNPTPDDDYHVELKLALNLLKNNGLDVSIHGDGKARFLFVENMNRTVEISRSGERIFIELFEDEVTQEYFVKDFQTAVQQTIDWFKK